MRHNFRKYTEGIESDVKRMIDEGKKKMEVMKGANERKGLEAVFETKIEKEAEIVVEPEMDEEKGELETEVNYEVVIEPK